MKLSMDFDNTNLTTTDNLNINAEQISLNGLVVLSQPLVTSNIQATDIQTTTVEANTLTMNQSYTGTYGGIPDLQPLQMGWSSITTTDFTNQFQLASPESAPNYFNSYNVTQWNDSAFNAVYSSAATQPHILVGDVITVPAPPVYSGEFYINNATGGAMTNLNIYQNVGGIASTIGVIAANTFARIRTTNGSNWSIDSNVSNPNGAGTFQPYIYQSQLTTSFTEALATQRTQQLFQTFSPTIQLNANRVIMRSPIVRINTIGTLNFPTREAGIEFSSYFDASVVFSGTQSDAINPILNPTGTLYYPFSAWSAQCWFGRIRTTDTAGIQGFDILGIPTLYAGSSEFIWSSQRYLDVNADFPTADIREMYLMIPANYMSFTSFTNAW